VQQLQQRLQSSGLTPDQVRSRLRAQGYPEGLLDQYLSGSGGSAGSARGGSAVSTGAVLNAMETLGVTDSSDAQQLLDQRELQDYRRVRRNRSLATGARDFLADTVPRGGTTRLPDSAGVSGGARTGTDSLRPLPQLLPSDSSTLAAVARDSGLIVFGSELFQEGSSLFDANLAGSVDENYTLGPGDRLVLILTGDVENAYELQVTREGFVVVPQVGQLYVANLTLGELNRLLGSRLARVYSGVRSGSTRFSVSVAQLRTNQVFVVGDVQNPGSYRVSSAGTALSALYAAGGPSAAGSLRRIEIRRAGRVVDVLDVYDYLLRGDASRDVRLRQGDVVFVPPRLVRVRAVGEVLRPATYELKPGETLDDLLRATGGFTAVAAPRQITIDRVLPPAQRGAGGRDRVVLTVNAVSEAGAPTLPLVNGDVVRVARIAERVRNRVAVRGNVWNAGTVGFRPGMTVSDALRAAGGVKPDTYLGQLLVTRLQPDSSRVQLRAVLRDTTGAVLRDFALQDDDEVEVFSVTTFRPERYVAIGGAVRSPGRFRYRAGMTLRDVVLLAGGLEEGALLTEAEIARLPESRANGVTARTVRVPLDSTYLFDRIAAGAGAAYVSVPGVEAPAQGAPDVALAPYDNVLILRQPDFQLQRTVFIGGEVRFPGRYALRQRTERLSELLSRAGGLTAEGYADGVTFFRLQGNTGRVGIDLPRVLREPRDRDNFILQDGDSIVVPAFNPVVRVAGAVNAPSAVAYVPGRSLDYYVRAAGGGGRAADLGRAYVQQPNGKVESVIRRRFLPDDQPTPRAGAQVVVPERASGLAGAAQAAGIFAQIAGPLAGLIGVLIALRR
jgi:protein involved in polysaccharide export with SLBB domain